VIEAVALEGMPYRSVARDLVPRMSTAYLWTFARFSGNRSARTSDRLSADSISSPSVEVLRVVKQVDEGESPAGLEHSQRLCDAYGLVHHVSHLVEGQRTDHSFEVCVSER
jgi:hypothetical protein